MRFVQAKSCCIDKTPIIDRDTFFDASRIFSKHATPDRRIALISLPIAVVMHQAETGISVEEACRQIGISRATFMRGRSTVVSA